jgi:hypothetical protein
MGVDSGMVEVVHWGMVVGIDTVVAVVLVVRLQRV